MSILIRNIEMPKNCGECPMICDYDLAREARGKEKAAECPLIEIPPHGDLIDRDALTTVTEMVNGAWKTYIETFEIEDAPTIIEAEGER